MLRQRVDELESMGQYQQGCIIAGSIKDLEAAKTRLESQVTQLEQVNGNLMKMLSHGEDLVSSVFVTGPSASSNTVRYFSITQTGFNLRLWKLQQHLHEEHSVRA